MTVRNRVNMRVVYFILSLLLISCSKDDASEAPGKFELQSISIGEKQDQSSFENVAPNASIVLTFTDAVDEATIQSNIILKLNDQAVAYDSKLQGKDKLSLTPTGGFKSFSSYKLVINPGVKSTSGVSLTNGKVYEIRTGMDDSDKFDRIPDEDLLTLVQKQTFKYFWNFGHAHSGEYLWRSRSQFQRLREERTASTLAYHANWKAYFGYIADCLKRYTSQRDKQKGELFVHGFTLAMTAQNRFYRPISEQDTQAGYVDIFLCPLLDIYSGMKHSYIVELKYAKYKDPESRVEELRLEGITQANRYAETETVKNAVDATQLHKIVVVYKGMDMPVCEEI